MTLDIMMPFYGRVDHFRLAVESVRAQTNPDWRLVVLDDCYPDVTAGQWLVSLNDPRIEYIRHSTNVGINANFQAAIDHSRNEWLVIFGCDDVMLPGYVDTVATLAATHPRAAMIHPATAVIDADGVEVRTLVDSVKARYRPSFTGTIELSGEDLATSITRGNWMNFPAIAWRRETVAPIGFRQGFQIVQDLALALDVAFAGGTLVLDDQVVFQYRRHSESVSSFQAAEGSRFVEEKKFFTQIAQEFAARGWPRATRAARVHLSSRINALTRLPGAFAARQLGSVRVLLAHALR
ncbi:MAG TPA: glycosyltransferase [Glaciihabitans sp.]|nr:glycosyltransferase [Glaciihabitans sp.]